MKVQRQISPKNYQSANGFIYHYQRLVKDVVIPYQYQVLNDQVEGKKAMWWPTSAMRAGCFGEKTRATASTA